MSKKLLFTLIPALLLGSANAHAAFEWVPATNATPSVSSSAPINTNDFVPLPDKQPVVSEPLPMVEPVAIPQAPAPVAMPEKMAMSSVPAAEPVIAWNPKAEMSEAVAMPPKAPMMEPQQAMKPEGFVEGFGRDIPLSIATAQIVPTNYAVQYGQGASPDVLVNWQGGRDWKAALTEAVAAQNMRANISGQTVIIESNAPIYVAPSPILPQPTAPIPVAMAPSSTPDIQVESIDDMSMMPADMLMRDDNQYAAVDNTLFAPLSPIASDAGSSLNRSVMWVAPRASTLRQVLTDWAREAGVQLQWSAQYDYPLMSDVQVSGTFEDAVENILAGLVDAQPRPVARLHPNEPSGPAILVVETRYIME